MKNSAKNFTKEIRLEPFDTICCVYAALQIQINTLRPRQNDRHFPDVTFKCICLNENVSISIEISLKFVLKGPFNNIPALAHIMAWRRPGAKPLSEPVVVSLLTLICVTRSQWVKDISSCIKVSFHQRNKVITRARLGRVAPLGRPRSVYKSDVECRFVSRNGQILLKVKANASHFQN